MALGDDREDAGDADAVRAHRDRGELAVLVEHLEAERVGVLAAELEDVPDLDAACELDRTGAVGRRVAGAHVGGLDDAVGDEVAARDEVEHVLLVEVGAGDPPVPSTTRGSTRKRMPVTDSSPSTARATTGRCSP